MVVPLSAVMSEAVVGHAVARVGAGRPDSTVIFPGPVVRPLPFALHGHVVTSHPHVSAGSHFAGDEIVDICRANGREMAAVVNAFRFGFGPGCWLVENLVALVCKRGTKRCVVL